MYEKGGSYAMSCASGKGAICFVMGLERIFLHLIHRLRTARTRTRANLRNPKDFPQLGNHMLTPQMTNEAVDMANNFYFQLQDDFWAERFAGSW